VLSDADLLDVQHPAERGKDGDFVLQRTQLAGGDGAEARVPQGSERGYVPNGSPERLERSHVADAAAQLAILLEGDERAALLRQRLEPHRRVFELLVIAHGAFHGFAGDLEQLVFLAGAERERLLGGGSARRSFKESHGAVAHDAGLVAGRIAGIRIVQHLGLRGSKPLGSDHGGDDGISAAGFPDVDARFEVARHAEVVPLLDGLQGLVVDFDGLGIGMVVGEVGTGDDESVGAGDQLGQRQPQRAAGFIALVADDDGHELERAEHALEEGELIFESVFGLVGRGRVSGAGELDELAHAGELGGERPVHGDLAQRGGVGSAVVHGRETERFVVRRRDDHHAVELAAFEQGIGVGGHLAGVLVTGVRRDQGHDVGDRSGRGLGQETIHHFRKLGGIGRIERSGDGGGPHLVGLGGTGGPGPEQNEPRYQGERDDNDSQDSHK